MFAGFEFNPETAVHDCKAWLSSCPDIELEYIETQRATIQRMLDLSVELGDRERESLTAVERLLYNHLVNSGAVSSPVIQDEALGGDLVHLKWDSSAPGRPVDMVMAEPTSLSAIKRAHCVDPRSLSAKEAAQQRANPQQSEQQSLQHDLF